VNPLRPNGMVTLLVLCLVVAAASFVIAPERWTAQDSLLFLAFFSLVAAFGVYAAWEQGERWWRGRHSRRLRRSLDDLYRQWDANIRRAHDDPGDPRNPPARGDR
jgi:hypothetical protein